MSETDRVFNWRPKFDARSLDYPIRGVVADNVRRNKLWKIGPILDQGREGSCFPPTTLIRKADGSQCRIDELKLLDQVVTAEGRVRTVEQLMVREANRGLVRVNIAGHIPLLCTPEHPILTNRGYIAAENLSANEDEVSITKHNLDFVYSDYIDIGALVDTRGMRGTVSGEVNTGGVVSEVATLPAKISLTPDFGRLIGLYAAEGSTTPNKVVWCFGAHEEETLVAETVSLVGSVFGATARIQKRPNNSINVVLYGKTWRLLFEKLVPGTSRWGDKHLSSHVTGGNAEYLDALLQGWLDGDGHYRRTEVTGITVCRELALNMHSIATDLGYLPRLNVYQPSPNRHAAMRQMRYEIGIGLSGVGNRSAQSTNSSVWRKVRSVEPVEYDGYVYNIEVEGDHSYIADGVGVHNCVGHGWAAEALSTPTAVNLDRVVAAVPHDPEQFAQYVYHTAQTLDNEPGENYEGTSVLAGAKAMTQFGLLKEYRWAFSIEDVINAVIHRGPVVLGIEWHKGMYQAPGGVLTLGGPVVGGHCITAVGYRTAGSSRIPGEETVILQNSWGPDWGINGTAEIRVTDLKSLLDNQGEACVPYKRSFGRK